MMWCLINKKTDKIIPVYVTFMSGYEIYVKGFKTKKGLETAIMFDPPKHKGEIRKIDESWKK